MCRIHTFYEKLDLPVGIVLRNPTAMSTKGLSGLPSKLKPL